MQIKFLSKEINYTGEQLKSHWAYREFDIKGDCIVAFVGACSVDMKHLVDIEDVKKNSPIYSEKMLHFIAEHFDNDLEKAVLRQRLLVAITFETLKKSADKHDWQRLGDDIYCCSRRKLSVSIASASPVSTLIHFGINISSKNTPVRTIGLADCKINPKIFGQEILKKYKKEIESMHWARCKVKEVQ